MDSRKETFLIYLDHGKLLNILSDEEAGKTIKSLVSYCQEGTLPDRLSSEANIIFSVMRGDIDRNHAKWEETKKQRAEAGRKGGVASGVSRAKQKEANEAFASQSKQNEANEAVYVNVNETVSVNENVPVSVMDRVEGSRSAPNEADWNEMKNRALKKLEESNRNV